MQRFKFYCLSLFLLFFSPCEGRIDFVHIPKTGGTTISTLLKENFPIYQFYPYASFFKPLSEKSPPSPLATSIEEMPLMQERVAWGHFPYWFFLQKDPDIDESFLFTCLRDPVDRVLSLDRYTLLHQSSEKKKLVSDPANLTPNVLCHMLCSKPDLEGEELLEDCMRTLERMDFVLFMEDFSNGVKQLCHLLHLKCPAEVPHINTTKKESVSEEVIDLIRENNSLDVRLYEYARERFLLPRLQKGDPHP